MGAAQSSAQLEAQAEAMVSTRRSSRLQARSGAEGSPASSGGEAESARASPARGSRRSPRGRSKEQEEEKKEKEAEEVKEQSEESAQDIPVEDDSTEDVTATDATDSDAIEHGKEQKKAVEEMMVMAQEPVEAQEPAEIPEPANVQEEEEEILMLDDDDDEEEDEVAVPPVDDAETETDDDAAARGGEEDVTQYALLAASGLDLFGAGSSSTSTAPAASVTAPKRTVAAVKRSLVPDQLDSGASQHSAFFEFKGRRHADGAALLADKRSKEEQAVVSKGLDVVARSHQQREETRKKTAGRKWFDMESDELTADARRDFALLRMRNYLDPKKFYKSSDHHKKLPKHFQMGAVVEGAHEFKSARMTKKERRQTFTDEIMADDNVRQYTKRVFSQVQAARSGRGKKKAKKTHRAF